MSTRDFFYGKGDWCLRLTTYHPRSVERQEKSGALNYPDSLGPPRPVVGDLYLIEIGLLGTESFIHVPTASSSNSGVFFGQTQVSVLVGAYHLYRFWR